VVDDAEVKKNKEDHSSEWMERSAQKRFDRADIARDFRLAAVTGTVPVAVQKRT
jgi:hypothetical protein